MNYEYFDNVVSDQLADILEASYFRVPFYYLNNITYAGNTTLYKPGFYHNISDKESIQSDLYSSMLHVLYTFAHKANIEINTIIRSRLFLLMPNSKDIDYQIHRDFDFAHKVFIYYVNNSEGPTKLYNNNELIDKVQPKKGRGLFFDGSIFHKSTQPIYTTRLILNVNFL